MRRFVLAWSPIEWSPAPLVFWLAASSLQLLPLPSHGFFLSMCLYLSGFFSKNTYYTWPLLNSYISKSLVSIPPPQKNTYEVLDQHWLGGGGDINQLIEAFLLGLSYPKAKPNNSSRPFPFHSTPIIHTHRHMWTYVPACRTSLCSFLNTQEEGESKI